MYYACVTLHVMLMVPYACFGIPQNKSNIKDPVLYCDIFYFDMPNPPTQQRKKSICCIFAHIMLYL